MKAEISAVQKMTNGMQSAGMDEAQALAVVEAIAEGIQTFAVTRDVLREELLPVHERIDKLDAKFDAKFDGLDNKFDAKFDVLSGRMFYLMLTMIGAMVAMFGSMIAMLLT